MHENNLVESRCFLLINLLNGHINNHKLIQNLLVNEKESHLQSKRLSHDAARRHAAIQRHGSRQ